MGYHTICSKRPVLNRFDTLEFKRPVKAILADRAIGIIDAPLDGDGELGPVKKKSNRFHFTPARKRSTLGILKKHLEPPLAAKPPDAENELLFGSQRANR